MAQTPLQPGFTPIPETTTLAQLIAIVNANFSKIPYRFKGDAQNIFVDQTPSTVTIRLNDGDDNTDGPGAGGGGPPGFPLTGSFEITYVNSTGCIQDPNDPTCMIPFDVQFRDQISFTAGVLTRTLLNAFTNMHTECKFKKCEGSSGYSSSGANYLDRWRPCDAASGSASDDGDIFLDEVFLQIAMSSGFDEPVIRIDSVCYEWVETVQGENQTVPVLAEFFEGCAADECHTDPCDDLCKQTPTNSPTANIANQGCPSSQPNDTAFNPTSFSAAGGPGGTPLWTWTGTVNSALLKMYCSAGGAIFARLCNTLGTGCFGAVGGPNSGYKDVSATVTCSGGNLSGTFTLVNVSDFCTGGDQGTRSIVVTL